MKLWKVGAAALAMAVGAGQAQAEFFSAYGSVLDQPVVTSAGGTGTITFNNARVSGFYVPQFSRVAVPGFTGTLNFSVAYDIAAPMMVYANLPNVLVSSPGSVKTTDFDASDYLVSVRLDGDVLDGSIRFVGLTPDGGGGLSISFRGNNVSGYTSGFLLQVPEPGTWALMLLGVGMIGYAARRRPGVAFAA